MNMHISEQCATPVLAIRLANTMRNQGFKAVVVQQGSRDWRVFGWR